MLSSGRLKRVVISSPRALAPELFVASFFATASLVCCLRHVGVNVGSLFSRLLFCVLGICIGTTELQYANASVWFVVVLTLRKGVM